MSLFLVILLLEIRPMTTFIGWRARTARGDAVDTSAAGVLSVVSTVQALLVVLMVLAATAMARGYGL